MSLDECLPPALRGPATTITPIAAGLSGAGVYRVEAAGETFVLKIAADATAPDEWRRRVEILEHAAAAGLAPRVVHVDEARRAVVSAFVADRGFLVRLVDPRTRVATLEDLGRTLARVHALPAAGAPVDLHERLEAAWAAAADVAPPFVAEAVRAMRATTPPAPTRAPAQSHNDVNPTNIVFDGERLILLDWDAAAPNDPLFDLAAIAMFLRLDDATCARLIAAHDGAAVGTVDARFRYLRRFIALLCGVVGLAQTPRGDETADLVLALADVHQRLRTGELDLRTPDGRRAFALALVVESDRP